MKVRLIPVSCPLTSAEGLPPFSGATDSNDSDNAAPLVSIVSSGRRQAQTGLVDGWSSR